MAVFVALLIPVLIGCAALSVDVGSLTSGRRSLQNAADAVSLSAAQTCAKTGTCPSQGDAGLSGLADDNDSGSTITKLCGVGTGLTPCDPLQDSLSDCPIPAQSPPAGTNFVRAYTEKKQDFVFAPVIGGGNSAMEQTCAGVAWGPISTYSGPLPLTFSGCEWNNATGGGANYAPAPPYPPYPDPSLQRAVVLADSSHPVDCGQFNGHDAPGGFGWLSTGPGCKADISLGNWYQVDTGNNVDNNCKPVIASMVNTIVFIPVFDCMNSSGVWPADPATQCATGNGTHLWYHLYALAAFYLTGYQLGSISHTPASGPATCPGNGGSGRCLFGYFVKALAPPGGAIGGPGTPDLGVQTIQMIG